MAGAAGAIVARLRGVPGTRGGRLPPGLLSTSILRPCYKVCLSASGQPDLTGLEENSHNRTAKNCLDVAVGATAAIPGPGGVP